MVGELGLLGWLIGKHEREYRGGGGGGRQYRIRYGNSGPRSRFYSTWVRLTGSRRPHVTVVVKNKYFKAGKGARSAIKGFINYIEKRELGKDEQERAFFNGTASGIGRDEVLTAVLAHMGRRVAMHTLILSPGDNTLDLERYTRECMESLEERFGHDLTWFGTVHENTKHHHVHVVIAGRIPGKNKGLSKERQEGGSVAEDALKRRVPLSWQKEKDELTELLGHRMQEEPTKDPREERRDERKTGNSKDDYKVNEREKDVVPESIRSVNELIAERSLDRYERKRALKNRAAREGDVYIDTNDLRELRCAGNDFKYREKALDYELDSAFRKEFGLDRSLVKQLDLTKSWSEISKMLGLSKRKDLERQRDEWGKDLEDFF